MAIDWEAEVVRASVSLSREDRERIHAEMAVLAARKRRAERQLTLVSVALFAATILGLMALAAWPVR